jgi:cephalosporin-C deacetylase-like acetyl esterase
MYRSLPARLAVVLLSCLAALAQPQAARVQIRITPDHADWNYKTGEPVTFTIRATKDGAALAGVTANWSAGPEMMPPVTSGTVQLGADGAHVTAGSMEKPGFLRLIATLQDEGRVYRGVGTAGFEPEKIQAVTGIPDDFDQFWADGKAALARIAIDPQRKPDLERSTATLDAFEVSIQNVSGGGRGTSRIYGILTVPKAPGKYPALLRVPGAGVYPASSIVRDHEDGVITLSIGIHGVPLTMDPAVYQNLASGALNGYQEFNLDSRDRYYYRRVYLGCVRAIDYLTSLAEWDGKTVAVTGNSQGGALAIVTAALDPRVGALASYHPALSDQLGYVHGRAGGWPNVFRNEQFRTKEKMETAAYYDTVNFARKVKVPGLYSWGYNDETCAPTSTFAVFNTVTAPKTLTLQIETGHTIVPEQRARVNRWIQEFLKTGKAPAGVQP